MKRYIHRRNIRFKNEIAKADKSKILGVAIDPSSNFHRVVIFNFLGEIIGEPFSIDTLKIGYDLLIKNINKANKKTSSIAIFIAIESAGSYSENLYIHLCADFKNVVFITALSVWENRKQKSLLGLKTDDIDCGAIGDLLIRGEFTKSIPDTLVYYKLRNLIYWRERKMSMAVMLKNQITNRMTRCYPGLNCDFNENKKLYADLDNNLLYQGLMSSCMTGQQLLETPDEVLLDKFNYGIKFTRRKQRIKQFRNRLNVMLLPDENFARTHLEILAVDIKLLRLIEKEINQIEEKIVELGKKTSAVYIMGQIKGITDLYASIYIGLIGDFRKYKYASNIYSLSGLSPRIRQSGAASMSHSTGIKRAGNRLLRSLLFNMARFVIVNDPFFGSYYQRIKVEKNRNWKKNFIAVARKLNRVLFALMRDKSQFRGKATGSSTKCLGY
jgi:transposase